jgi:hypothetical protein
VNDAPPVTPDDVTLGELWRLHVDQRSTLVTLVDEVRMLPSKLHTELGLLVEQRIMAHEREYGLRIEAIKERVDLMWRAGLGVVAFVCVSVGGALIALVLNNGN